MLSYFCLSPFFRWLIEKSYIISHYEEIENETKPRECSFLHHPIPTLDDCCDRWFTMTQLFECEPSLRTNGDENSFIWRPDHLSRLSLGRGFNLTRRWNSNHAWQTKRQLSTPTSTWLCARIYGIHYLPEMLRPLTFLEWNVTPKEWKFTSSNTAIRNKWNFTFPIYKVIVSF